MWKGGYSSDLDIKTKAFYSEETNQLLRKAQTRHIVYFKIYWEVHGEGDSDNEKLAHSCG